MLSQKETSVLVSASLVLMLYSVSVAEDITSSTASGQVGRTSPVVFEQTSAGDRIVFPDELAVSARTEVTGVNVKSAGGQTESASVQSESTSVNTESAGVRTESTGVNTESAGVRTESTGVNTKSAGGRTKAAAVETETAGVRVESAGVNTESAGVRTEAAGVNTESTVHDSTEGVVESYGCPSDVTIPCVSKCCNISQGYANNRTCIENVGVFAPNFTDCPGFAESIRNLPLDERYEYFMGEPCKNGKYMLQPEEFPEEAYLLFSNGSMYMAGRMLTMSEYCLETFNNVTEVFVCFTEAPKEVKFQYILYPIGLLISVPFLLTTGLVYICDAQFRDTQGKSLACHVFCLAIAYFFLAIVQLTSDKMNEELCITAGFTIQFFFIACFFWLNVMCYDTWRNIQTATYHPDGPSRHVVSKEGRKFVMYSMYAWYGPAILLIITLIMDLEPGIPESLLKPHFGYHSCWFHTDSAALPYFYGPVGFLVMINIVFFTLSIRQILKYDNERKDSPEYHRSVSEESETRIIEKIRLKLFNKKLNRCIQLFSVMGINWVAEILSWALGGPIYIWVVTDVFNTLQGLLIFYMFVIREERVKNGILDDLKTLKSKMCQVCCKSHTHEAIKQQPDDEESGNGYNTGNTPC